ncbi:OLC1v1005385C1 [Oldenlandia corymbosa var. corymbosa]|uniref:OLC1v1005385C1 n=1 Tax=Oldenlandia corymbosa var. corymbosa TaxID=529605 RepID=A0AAV1DEK6_OLDCO|nr:OLC1v1005385C1 [Oldenlandia corymbosa var. corymbosa]
MFNLQDSLEDFGGDGEDYSILFATDEEFAKKDDAVAWVKGMGMANAMLINVVSSKKKNVVLMRCCKEGNVSVDDGEYYITSDSKTQITGCKFKLYVHLVDGKWRIRVYPGEFGMHNHDLFDEDHPTRGLSDGVKQLIQGMSKDGCRPCQIMAAIERIFPDEKVNRRQVYNFRKKLRNEGFPVLGESSAMDVTTKTLSVAKHHGYIIMTYCNQETGKVESAHKQLKTWLKTSAASLDTLWAKVHLEIQSQLTEIRYKLEYSRQKIGTHYCSFPLNRLKCQVSHTCLQKLNTEWSKAQEWKEETNDQCDHVVYWTCRIPCACALKKAADAGTSITLKHIHPFWATLNIGEQAGTSTPSDVDDEVLYTRQLMEELNECPKAKKATPNVWDYRDDAQGKSTTVTSDSSKKRPSSSGGRTDASTEIFASDISQYGCYDLIPWPIRPYITSYLDVGADGNCGFRVVASNMFLSQDKWAMAREAMANELEQNWHLYTRIYGTSLQEEVRRILWSGQGFAPERHWMCVTDLFVVATMNNAIVYYYGAGEENQSLNSTCWTILPVTARGEATCPAFEIGVCHHGLYKHFIRINLDGDFPVPPISNRWTKEHQPSVAGWELPLLPRIQDWYRLVPNNPGRSIGDYANDFIDLSFLD